MRPAESMLSTKTKRSVNSYNISMGSVNSSKYVNCTCDFLVRQMKISDKKKEYKFVNISFQNEI